VTLRAGQHSNDALPGDYLGVLLRESGRGNGEGFARCDVDTRSLSIVKRFARRKRFGTVPEYVNSERYGEGRAVGPEREAKYSLAWEQVCRYRIRVGGCDVLSPASYQQDECNNGEGEFSHKCHRKDDGTVRMRSWQSNDVTRLLDI